MTAAYLAAVTGRLAVVPVEPDRGTARRWAVQELSRREYQQARPGLIERALTWLWSRLDLLDLGTGAPPVPALVTIAVLVAVLIAYVVHRSGGLRGPARRRAPAVLPVADRSATEHRSAADRHAEVGDWGLAVVERFRAIARELQEAALVVDRPGRTALEVARDGGSALPELAADLIAAARSFDDVWYGRLPVGPEADREMREVESRLLSRTRAGAR